VGGVPSGSSKTLDRMLPDNIVASQECQWLKHVKHLHDKERVYPCWLPFIFNTSLDNNNKPCSLQVLKLGSLDTSLGDEEYGSLLKLLPNGLLHLDLGTWSLDSRLDAGGIFYSPAMSTLKQITLGNRVSLSFPLSSSSVRRAPFLTCLSTCQDAAVDPSFLRYLSNYAPNLKRLDIRMPDPVEGEQVFFPIRSLEDVMLNQVGDEEVQVLARNNRNLKYVWLSSCCQRMSDVCLSHLASLEKLISIHVNNDQVPFSASAVTNFLRSRSSRSKVIRFSAAVVSNQELEKEAERQRREGSHINFVTPTLPCQVTLES